jgi:hypothetical protein
VRLVPGPRGRGPRPPAIASRVAEVDASPVAAAPPEKRRQGERSSPWPWKVFSLDSENLMRVRRITPPAYGLTSHSGKACRSALAPASVT